METLKYSLDKKLVVYDSNCKVCTSLKDLLTFLAPFMRDKVVTYKSLSGSLVSKVDPERFKNEMALIDMENDKTLYGPDGIAYIFSSKSGIIRFLFRVRILKTLFVFLYKTLAYNRYFVALPVSKFKCDCYPDNVLKYRLSFIIITYTISIILTALFGISVKDFFPEMTSVKAATQMLLMAGTGWLIQIALAVLLLKEKALDYLMHLGTIMVAGLLILVPWIVFHSITGLNLIFMPVISVAISSMLMLYMHIRRANALEISGYWSFSWFLLLQTTAALWIYIFHFNS